MRMREWTKEEKRMVQEGIIVVIGANIILVIDFLLLNNFLFDALNLREGAMSLFEGLRIILLVLYPIGFLPASLLAEVADSRMRKRPFRVRNVLLLLLFLGEFISVASILSTLLDLSFSQLLLVVQSPLAALCIGISLLLMAATLKVKIVHDFVKKAFD